MPLRSRWALNEYAARATLRVPRATPLNRGFCWLLVDKGCAPRALSLTSTASLGVAVQALFDQESATPG